MKTPTVEQLQAWTQQWDEAKRYLSYPKVFDQRLHPSQPASDTAEISQVMDDLGNQVGQEGLEQDPTEVEQVVDNLVNQVELQDQEAQSIQKAKVFEVVAGEHIATLRNELGRALEDLGLEPPWSARNSKSGLYRTDEHVIPLAIRLLDGLRLSKASGYIDFAESDNLYGCKSPFADSHLAVNTGLKDKIKNYPKKEQVDLLYRQALAMRVEMTEYVDELTSRLFNLNVDIMHIPVEKQDDIKNSIHADVSKLMARTAGDTLATVDKNMTEKTTSLVDRLMVNYFSIWREGLTDEENVELQTTTRSKIEQVFKQFNQEKNAERRLNDCFDLAFCAKASESDQSAERLQAMVDRVNFGVLRGASVNSAQWFLLLRIDGLESSQQVDEFDETEPIEAEDFTDLAKHAVRASSYGLLKATLDEMNARNMHVADDDWIDMTLDALERSEPSIIKQCLNIKGGDVASTFEGCTEEEQADLIYRAMDSDEMEYSMRSSEDRLQMLLDAGVDVNAKPKYRLGETALMRACRNGDEAIVSKFIEAGADVNVEDQFGHTALSAACFRRHEAVVTQLLDAKADVDVKDNRGETALMRACRDGGEAIVTQLIEARADVSAKDNRGGTALMAACRNGDEAIVLQLIEARADVSAKDNRGGTALMDACTYGDESIVLKLIEKNADINATTDYGKTALMYACEGGHDNVVSWLLEAGADVNTKDSKGKTAYDYAVDRGHARLANRVIALESTGTRANRIARETGRALGNPAVLAVLAGITTAAMYASGSLDTALESASQAMPEAIYAATNATSQALTELTTAATEIGHQMGYGPSL